MTVTPAHEVGRTVLCKHAECTDEALTDRGPYAGLCSVHKFAKRQELGALRREEWSRRRDPAPVPAAPVADGETYAQRVKALLAPARKLDKAREQAVRKRADARTAERHLAAAMEAFRRALLAVAPPERTDT